MATTPRSPFHRVRCWYSTSTSSEWTCRRSWARSRARSRRPASRPRHSSQRAESAPVLIRVANRTSGHDPLTVRDDPGAGVVGKAHDVAALGGKTLSGGERQTRVIAGDHTVLEHGLQPLDQVVAHEGVDHVIERFGEQPAGEVRVSLDLHVRDRHIADAEPAERIIYADAALIGQVDRTGHALLLVPASRAWALFQPPHHA